MSYCSFSDFGTIYSAGLLERLCTRAGDIDQATPVEVEARSQMALDSAAGLMDSFFVGVYPVPLQTTFPGTLATLRNCNAALAISELVVQKGYIQGTEDEQLVTTRRVWLDWLASVRNGKTAVPGVSTTPGADQVAGPDAFFVSSEEAFFPAADRFA